MPAGKKSKSRKSTAPHREVMAKAAARFERADQERAAIKSDPGKAVKLAKARFSRPQEDG